MPPRPVDDWPDKPVVESEVHTELDPPEALDSLPVDETVSGVWGMTREKGNRGVIARDEVPADAVVDLVLETPAEYHMYSYTQHDGATQWVAYETEEKGTESAARFETTLEHYALLAGESDLA